MAARPRGWRWALAAWLLLAAGLAWAQALQPIPALQGRVIDTTGTLDTAEQAGLEAALERLERERGAQVVVLLVPTTQPEDIAAYANRVANAWKIGRREVGDGVLLLLAKNDRRLRIEVAKALEGAIPDLAAKRIIDEAITPRLRQGDYAGALQAGVAQIDARIRAEGLPTPEDAPSGDGAWDADLPLLFFALFFIVPAAAAVLRGMLGRKLGALAAGAGAGAFTLLFLQLAWWLAVAAAAVAFVIALVSGGFAPPSLRPPTRRGRDFGHGGGWSGGGGWGSGGGFGSGGGGNFGGGGASGDW